MYFFFAYFLHLQQFSISLKWFLVVNLWALFKGLLGTFQLFLVSPLVLITPLMGLRPSQSIGYSKAWFELKKQSQIICCIGTALKEKHSAESQSTSSFADTEEKKNMKPGRKFNTHILASYQDLRWMQGVFVQIWCSQLLKFEWRYSIRVCQLILASVLAHSSLPCREIACLRLCFLENAIFQKI